MLEKISALWWTRRRVQWCLKSAYGLYTATWLLCYALWLGQGCEPFLPFVSDFGDGLSAPVFMVGMTVAALLAMPNIADLYLATRDKMEEAGCCRRCLHSWMPVLGLWCKGSIIGVALNPWDIRIDAHVLFADGIFFGSIAFTLMATLLTPHAKGGQLMVPLLLVGIAFTSCGMMFWHFGAGMELLGEDGVEQSATMMRNDYRAYCTGQGESLHRHRDFNIAAAYEWSLLSSVIVIVFVTLRRDLRGWPRLAEPSEAEEATQLGRCTSHF